MLSLLATAFLSPPARPSLVVVLSIDQFRSDYLTRYENLYLPAQQGGKVGGFRYLMENGANFINARYHHIPTATGPGHSVICSGSTPGLTGIVSNTWYDATTGKQVYCVSDPNAHDVLTGKQSMSPKNLRVTTVGDELKLATNGRCTNVSIALKDRAAILLAGHTPDAVLWFDRASGGWTTSDYFAPNKKLPEFADQINAQKIPDRVRGKAWEATVKNADHYSFPTLAGNPPSGFGASFPHQLPDKGFYDLFTYTPMANQFVIDTAEAAIDQYKMGSHEVSDILTMNFSSNDYIGHAFGPYSPEVMEMAIGTDLSISRLLNYLKGHLAGGLKSVLFVLTADHGVAPVTEDLIARRIPAERIGEGWEQNLHAKLKEKIGVDGIAYIDDDMIWLDHRKLTEAKVEISLASSSLVEILRADPTVFQAETQETAANTSTNEPWIQGYRWNIDRERSADIFFAFRPGMYQSYGDKGTGHGTPWVFDTSVPMIFAGPGIATGRFMDVTGPEDIAPTISACLGIIPPSGCIGKAVGLSKD